MAASPIDALIYWFKRSIGVAFGLLLVGGNPEIGLEQDQGEQQRRKYENSFGGHFVIGLFA
jgi:hypothetical protein